MNRFRIYILSVLFIIPLFFGCSTTATVPAGEAAEVWYNLGNAYTELGRNDDAIKAYLKARQLNPELVSAGFNLVRVQILQKRYDDSLEQLDLLLEADPENRMLLETKAWVYHLKGDDRKALEIYDSVLSVFKDSRNSLYNSSIVLIDLEEYAKALEQMKRLVEIYPDEKSSIFEIAKIEAQLGNSEESLLWLEKHLSENPKDATALELAGDMSASEKEYAEAVGFYRLIIGSEQEEGEGSIEMTEPVVTGDVLSRVNFKIGEILLVQIEDVEGGMQALRASVSDGKPEKEDIERILSYTDAEWYEEAEEILGPLLDNEEAEDSASAEIENDLVSD